MKGESHLLFVRGGIICTLQQGRHRWVCGVEDRKTVNAPDWWLLGDGGVGEIMKPVFFLR